MSLEWPINAFAAAASLPHYPLPPSPTFTHPPKNTSGLDDRAGEIKSALPLGALLTLNIDQELT